MSKWEDTTLDREASESALRAAEKKRFPAKSDAMLVFLDSYMPPIEVHSFDGSVRVVPYAKLDEAVAELRATFKERRKARC